MWLIMASHSLNKSSDYLNKNQTKTTSLLSTMPSPTTNAEETTAVKELYEIIFIKVFSQQLLVTRL